MTKLPYERPILVRHQMGLMNKFSRIPASRPLDAIDGVPVTDLVEQYGSPLFVFSERTLVDRYHELHDAFARRYPKVRMAWSYKTNYLDAICTVFHREGAFAEVVSEMELEKARRLGIAAADVHFNGPDKSEAVLERVLPGGTTIHIDHFDELLAAERVAERHDIRPGVALRLNLSVDSAPQWTRFGFNLESGQAMDAVQRLLAGGRLELTGLHCHLGTFLLDPSSYRQAAEKLCEFANELKRRFGVVLSFLDLGGGFASHNTLKGQYLPGEQATPSFTAYADAVCDGLSKLEYPPRERPTLVLENGRALVDDAGYLITSVLANKRLPDGRRGVIVDGGVNILFTSFWYNHDVLPTEQKRGMPEPSVIYGPLCMNIDILRDSVLLPPVDVGDHLVFRNVGAYNVTQWMQFITYRPAVVMVSKSGEHGIIRRAEDLDALVRYEEVPSWLK